MSLEQAADDAPRVRLREPDARDCWERQDAFEKCTSRDVATLTRYIAVTQWGRLLRRSACLRSTCWNR